MNAIRLLVVLAFAQAFAGSSFGHDLGRSAEHPHYDGSAKPPGADGAPRWFLAQAESGATPKRTTAVSLNGPASRPAQAAIFEAFAPRVSVRWDARFLFVESNGLPSHGMMVGITNWQQQVPLPQPYTGANAWQIPLSPVPAKVPLSIKGRFLRGAIALAANGIPIFNPQNNRGEISGEIGELDQWGGHCGRADDYHYHAAPLHLESVVGKGRPIAYALDGYAIFGLAEPDGAKPAGLDALQGHTTAALGYHYHASTAYPYVQGGFHGEVVEAGGQVDPQPRAQPIREALPPARGAKIVGFETPAENTFKLSYELAGEKRAVLYAVQADGKVAFEFQNGREGTTKQIYTPREGDRPGGGRPPRKPGPPGERERPSREEEKPPLANRDAAVPSAQIATVPTAGAAFVLRSPEVADGGALPVDYTGDGSAATLPLEWSGAPAGTRSYALIMHHLDPEGKTKWYWTLYNLPADLTALPRNVKGVGALGSNSVNREIGYAPPHSKGPGPKTYVLTLYALSAPLAIDRPAPEVSREVLLAAMKDKLLASAELHVIYTRTGSPPAK
ncbi:MAG: hypothetical protein QOE70_752 [Chthoniobacter sp.]|jgi:phosphatidylethanolamine-binding protein (PEBP) family uncharacterized protein|nr:hypothetical protein [Chthoniobacter sp.]